MVVTKTTFTKIKNKLFYLKIIWYPEQKSNNLWETRKIYLRKKNLSNKSIS